MESNKIQVPVTLAVALALQKSSNLTSRLYNKRRNFIHQDRTSNLDEDPFLFFFIFIFT